jgi:ferredoxin
VSRVEVDRNRCVGSSTCEALAREVFEIDDGVLTVLWPVPADDELAGVRDPVRQCPTRALSLTE